MGQGKVLFAGKTVVEIAWRILAKVLSTRPIFARARPTFCESEGLRNVASASAEAAQYEDRLMGFKREVRLLGDARHCSLVSLDPAAQDDPRTNVREHGGSHCGQSFRPFVLLWLLRRKFQSLFPSKACAVQRKEDEVSGWFVVRRERCKFVRRHPDVHRPREVVCHDYGAGVPRMAPIAAHQLGQKPGEPVLPQISAVGQTDSGSEQLQRNLGHGVAQMSVAQPEDPQIGALRNRDPNRGGVPPFGMGSSAFLQPVRQGLHAYPRCDFPEQPFFVGGQQSAASRGSGYTIAGRESSPQDGTAANAINSGGRGVNKTLGELAIYGATRQSHNQLRKTSSRRQPATVPIRSVRPGPMRTTGTFPR